MQYSTLSIAQKNICCLPTQGQIVDVLTRFLFVRSPFARRSDCATQSLQKAGRCEQTD